MKIFHIYQTEDEKVWLWEYGVTDRADTSSSIQCIRTCWIPLCGTEPINARFICWSGLRSYRCASVCGCGGLQKHDTKVNDVLIHIYLPLKQLHRQCFPGNDGVDVTNKRVQVLSHFIYSFILYFIYLLNKVG